MFSWDLNNVFVFLMDGLNACVTDISPVIAKGVLCLKCNLSCPVCHHQIMEGFDCKYTKWNVTCHGKKRFMWNSGRETTRKREKMLQWAWQASECSQTKSWFWFVYLFHVCITFVLRWTYSLVLQTNRALLKHKAMIHTLLMFPVCFPHS